MFPSQIKFQLSNPPLPPPPPPSPLSLNQLKLGKSHRHHIGLSKYLIFSSLSLESTQPSVGISATSSPLLTSSSSVGSPPLLSYPTHRHITILNVAACVVAISTSWLFFSAIPALLALRRSAESLAKLMDVMREELPDTMAAVRLSGMEISDLTMELSDIGQEITKGVRSSTQAVRVAEDRLRRLTAMVPKAPLQEQVSRKTRTVEPVIAKTARSLREGIVKGRSLMQMFFSITRFSRLAVNYFASRRLTS